MNCAFCDKGPPSGDRSGARVPPGRSGRRRVARGGVARDCITVRAARPMRGHPGRRWLMRWIEKATSPENLRRALLLGPSLVVLAIFFFAPLVILLRYSFNRFVPGGGQQETFTIENYTR